MKAKTLEQEQVNRRWRHLWKIHLDYCTYEDHDDDCENDDGRDEIESHQEECDDEDGHEGDAQRLQRVLPHREVLLVEDVEDRVGEHFDLLLEKNTNTQRLKVVMMVENSSTL